MDLGVVQTGIESWLNLTAVDVDNGNAPLPVEFARAPNKIHTKPSVLVHRGPILKKGHDVPKYTYNDVTGEYIQQMWGVREMVVRLQFISYNQQDWEKAARQYAEDWRIRAESDRSIFELGDSAGLALIETGELVDLDDEWSGHLRSRVAASCRFRLWGYERSASTDQGYIWNVNMEAQNHIVDQWGNPVYDSLQNPVIDLDVRDISVSGSLAP
jgi:hypothetical protein